LPYSHNYSPLPVYRCPPTSRVCYELKSGGHGAENVFIMAVIHESGVTGPAAHALNNVIRDTRDEEVGGATGAKRMT